MLTPPLSSEYVSQGDFFRVVSYAVLLVGVWQAMRAAELGRAVAEERARVARDIHDGLAQYLFAISTQTSMLAGGAPVEQVIPASRRRPRQPSKRSVSPHSRSPRREARRRSTRRSTGTSAS